MRAVLIVLAVWLAGLGAAAQFAKVSMAYDLLALRYADQGPLAMAWMVSVVGLVGLVFGTTAGLIVARTGPRRAVVAGLVLGAVVSAVQALLPAYPVMMGLRVLEGVSHLAIVVVGPTAIAAVAGGRHLGLAMTLWSTFFGLTYAVLAVLAPPVLAAGGVAGLFGGHAVWMGASALMLGRLLPPDPAPPPRASGGLIAQHVAIYASPHVAAPALGFVFYTAVYVAMLTLLPPLLPEGLRLAVATGMPLVSIALSLTFGVWALRHVSAVTLVIGGFALAALGAMIFWVGLGQGAVMAVGALVMMGALGLVQGASFAAIPALNPATEDRARASGAIAQLGNVGTTTGTPLLAWMLAGMGPAGIAAFALPLCAGGIGMHLWLAGRRAASRSRPGSPTTR